MKDEALKLWMNPSPPDYKIYSGAVWQAEVEKVLEEFSKDNMIKIADEVNLAISGESPNLKEPLIELKQLQQDIELLDHKIKAHVNHLRYTRKWKTRAIKKSITKTFGQQITDIDVRSKELEKKEKGEVQPSTDLSNATVQGQASIS
jgi:hypothetical protein